MNVYTHKNQLFYVFQFFLSFSAIPLFCEIQRRESIPITPPPPSICHCQKNRWTDDHYKAHTELVPIQSTHYRKLTTLGFSLSVSRGMSSVVKIWVPEYKKKIFSLSCQQPRNKHAQLKLFISVYLIDSELCNMSEYWKFTWLYWCFSYKYFQTFFIINIVFFIN